MRGVGGCEGFVGRSVPAPGSQEVGLDGHGKGVLFWGFCFYFGILLLYLDFGDWPMFAFLSSGSRRDEEELA